MPSVDLSSGRGTRDAERERPVLARGVRPVQPLQVALAHDAFPLPTGSLHDVATLEAAAQPSNEGRQEEPMRRSSYAASQKAQYTRRSTGEITYSRPEAVAGDGRRLHRAARRTRGHERGRSHHRHSEEQRRIASAEGELGQLLRRSRTARCSGPTSGPARFRPGSPAAPQARQGPAGPAGARRRGRGRRARLHRRDADADEHELGRHDSTSYVRPRHQHAARVTVPANETDKLIVTFSAEDACYGGTSRPKCCNVRITVDGNELAPAAGSDANFDNNDLGVSGAGAPQGQVRPATRSPARS